MPQIDIPRTLLDEIEKVLPEARSADDFILQAVREKLSLEDRKKEFYRLSDQTRSAMTDKGLSEADILTDFESARQIF